MAAFSKLDQNSKQQIFIIIFELVQYIKGAMFYIENIQWTISLGEFGF